MTHNFTLSWSRNNETISQSVAMNNAVEQNFDITVPATTTNQHVAATIAVAQIQDVYITSDQNVTLLVNSTSAPTETITITAGKPVLWFTGCGWTNPFGHDITALYLTNAGATQANVKLRFGYTGV